MQVLDNTPWNVLQVICPTKGLKMYYHPCKGCKVIVSTCERREEIRRSIAGLYITSIKFRCKERTPLFPVGQRVEVTLPFWENDGESDCDECFLVQFHGTVIYETKRNGRFKVKIDDGPDLNDGEYVSPQCLKSGTGYVSVVSQYIKSIDEPAQTVCGFCEDTNGEHEGWCNR